MRLGFQVRTNLAWRQQVLSNKTSGTMRRISSKQLLPKATERERIIAALNQAAGKVSGSDGAAALLRMKPTTLYSRILALGLWARESASTNSRVA